MDLEVEEQDGKLLVHAEEQHNTVMTLLKQAVWDVGGRAGYDKGHQYTGGATLVVEGDDPRDTLDEALEQARADLDTFEDAFTSA